VADLNRNLILLAVIVLILGTAGFLVLVGTAADARIGLLLGIVTPTILGLMVLLRQQHTDQAMERVEHKAEEAKIATETLAVRGVSAVTAAVTAAAVEGARSGNGNLAEKVGAAVRKALVDADTAADEATRMRLEETRPRSDTEA
jgi:hypothetical protein